MQWLGSPTMGQLPGNNSVHQNQSCHGYQKIPSIRKKQLKTTSNCRTKFTKLYQETNTQTNSGNQLKKLGSYEDTATGNQIRIENCIDTL